MTAFEKETEKLNNFDLYRNMIEILCAFALILQNIKKQNEMH